MFCCQWRFPSCCMCAPRPLHHLPLYTLRILQSSHTLSWATWWAAISLHQVREWERTQDTDIDRGPRVLSDFVIVVVVFLTKILVSIRQRPTNHLPLPQSCTEMPFKDSSRYSVNTRVDWVRFFFLLPF